MVVSGSFAGCTGKAWCSFAGKTVVALCSLVGSTKVALCSFVGSTGVALCSFGGSTVVAPVGRSVLPVPLAERENAGRAWLGCPQHSCATRSPHSDVGLPRARLAWPADWACSTDVVGIMGAGMMVWCASSGTLMPLLATMLVTALVVPPPRPHKRQASSSDPSRAKRSRASSSSSTRIPSTSKAGMSSVNNSPAETARQSRREK
ncbi:hypothetical protein V6N12_018690 [Hibiscus sabdariffa]|uniref:Uncharacterized protein n=1 Tax=Hibiscus sabdariffa TaxID=183260 RepID=A0ABR2A2T0_9ROSI